jgi:hypothetical protein
VKRETEEEERRRVVDSEGSRRGSRTAGLRRFDFFDPIERNSWKQRHALGAGAVAHLRLLAVGFAGSFCGIVGSSEVDPPSQEIVVFTRTCGPSLHVTKSNLGSGVYLVADPTLSHGH